MSEEQKPGQLVPAPLSAEPIHRPPIPPQNAPKRVKMHKHHVKPRAPFLPKDHVAAKHGLRPK